MAAWREQAPLHARLPTTRARWGRALERTSTFLAAGPAYVSWSGGKDSTAVALLATAIHPNVPLAHFDAGLDMPETRPYMGRLAAERGWDLRRYQAGDALAEMIATGSWDHAADDTTDGTDGAWLWATRTGPAQMAVEDTGATGHMWGLRASENRRRLALMGRTRGTMARKDGWRSCSPIWDWRDLDVVAFLLHNQVELNPVYDRLSEIGAPADAHRLGNVIDPASLNLGRAVWLRRGWPDLWQRMVDVLPRLREDS